MFFLVCPRVGADCIVLGSMLTAVAECNSVAVYLVECDDKRVRIQISLVLPVGDVSMPTWLGLSGSQQVSLRLMKRLPPRM